MSVDLAPCPFCGGEAELRYGVPGCHWVECKVCNIQTEDMSPERALASWNRRAATSPAGDPEPEDTTDQWRNLALQFDGHRIEALNMLRYAVRSIEEYATVRDILREPLSALKAFLAKPPLSGEAVLAERIEALRYQSTGVTDAMILAGCRVLHPSLFSRGMEPRPGDGPATRAIIAEDVEKVRRVLTAALSAQERG